MTGALGRSRAASEARMVAAHVPMPGAIRPWFPRQGRVSVTQDGMCPLSKRRKPCAYKVSGIP